MTHVKLIDETSIQYPPKNKGSISNYNLNTEKLIEDGYKKFVPAQKEIGKAYKISYKETKNEIREIVEEIVPDPEEALKQEKASAIQNIKQKLNEIDLKSIRPLRAGEAEILFELESEAQALREELQGLQKQE